MKERYKVEINRTENGPIVLFYPESQDKDDDSGGSFSVGSNSEITEERMRDLINATLPSHEADEDLVISQEELARLLVALHRRD